MALVLTLAFFSGEVVSAPRELISGHEAEAYQLYLPGSQGVPPYIWSVISGELPPGMRLDGRKGILSAERLSKAGEYTFTLQLKDAANSEPVTEELKISIKPTPTILEPLRIITDSLPEISKDKEVRLFFAIRGGRPPIHCSLTGKLPEGLTLDREICLIAGSPKESGSFKIAITVQDSGTPPEKNYKDLELPVTGGGVPWWWAVLGTLAVILIIPMYLGFRESKRCPECGKLKGKYVGNNIYVCSNCGTPYANIHGKRKL